MIKMITIIACVIVILMILLWQNRSMFLQKFKDNKLNKVIDGLSEISALQEEMIFRHEQEITTLKRKLDMMQKD